MFGKDCEKQNIIIRTCECYPLGEEICAIFSDEEKYSINHKIQLKVVIIWHYIVNILDMINGIA